MTHEDASPNESAAPATLRRRVKWYARGGKGFQAAAALLILASIFAVVACLARSPSGGEIATEKEKEPHDIFAQNHLFHDWPKDRQPDLVLVLTGERHGYVLPCGCSSPQIGGVERLYNVVQLLKSERGWPIVALDLGDTPQKTGPADLPNIQGILKYDYTMRAMEKIGFQATSIGEYEAVQPLATAIDQLFQNPSLQLPTVLMCNLRNRLKDFKVGGVEQIVDWKIVETKIKVGVIGAMGIETGEAIEKVTATAFDPLADGKEPDKKGLLHDTLKAINAKNPDLRVLLYHGSPAKAVTLAKLVPQFDLILSQSEVDEPPSKTLEAGNTLIIQGVGHKGKYVGLVGVFLTGNAKKPYELHYQLLRLDESYLTPKAAEDGHPISGLMEQYTKELKTGDYLHKYPHVKVHPVQAGLPGKDVEYVGSGECKKCHKEAYKIWENSDHAHAYQTLVDAKRPSNRQYDAECIVCHTVGFTYKTGFEDAVKTPKLRDVGCESCHGPGSEHIKNKRSAAIHDLMNPFRAAPEETKNEKNRRLLKMNDFCQKCHDQENDVNWDFEKKWPKVAHPSPKKKTNDD